MWFSVALSTGEASPTDQSVQHGRTESSAGPGSWTPESGWHWENYLVVERGKGTLCESTNSVNKTLSCCWKRVIVSDCECSERVTSIKFYKIDSNKYWLLIFGLVIHIHYKIFFSCGVTDSREYFVEYYNVVDFNTESFIVILYVFRCDLCKS